MGTTIEPDTTLATLINVFTVEPARQRELVDFLVEITENVMRHVPGFVSANIHASLDGTRVVNYAQWESQGHFEAMMADPAAREHMVKARAIASAEPKLYTVAAVHHA